MDLKYAGLLLMVVALDWTTAQYQGEPFLTVKDLDLTSKTPSLLVQHSTSLEVFWCRTKFGYSFIPNEDTILTNLEHSSEGTFVKIQAPVPVKRTDLRVNDQRKYMTIQIQNFHGYPPFRSLSFSAVPDHVIRIGTRDEYEMRLAFQMTGATLDTSMLCIRSVRASLRSEAKVEISDLTSGSARTKREVDDYATCHIAHAKEKEGNVDVDFRCTISGLVVDETEMYSIYYLSEGSYHYGFHIYIMSIE
ncbi:hypothetical protein CAPTEDRAFT_210835 [Capitella teleta]|uniref:Uncharacterized protein n=1 Tax=Capitella teleta TaxID=283909 RepID=R7U9R7_CAPTE|nr:hypothetical protein CAPTEDRAFT_210835 [Capitella teleta]|eukprot:ELT99850.1 hypothetical protein CAPTEDRAFT_210835 [Capitella teleta]